MKNREELYSVLLPEKLPASENKFYTDSLSFPSPKLLDENLQTGHINFISDYDYEIPLVDN